MPAAPSATTTTTTTTTWAREEEEARGAAGERRYSPTPHSGPLCLELLLPTYFALLQSLGEMHANGRIDSKRRC